MSGRPLLPPGHRTCQTAFGYPMCMGEAALGLCTCRRQTREEHRARREREAAALDKLVSGSASADDVATVRALRDRMRGGAE